MAQQMMQIWGVLLQTTDCWHHRSTTLMHSELDKSHQLDQAVLLITSQIFLRSRNPCYLWPLLMKISTLSILGQLHSEVILLSWRFCFAISRILALQGLNEKRRTCGNSSMCSWKLRQLHVLHVLEYIFEGILTDYRNRRRSIRLWEICCLISTRGRIVCCLFQANSRFSLNCVVYIIFGQKEKLKKLAQNVLIMLAQ